MKYPIVSDADVAIGINQIPPELLKEAEDKGFDEHSNPYNKLFNELFFRGGQLNWKPEVSMGQRELGGRFLKSIMRSFSPKHEDKEMVCAYILSELVTVKEG